MSDLEERDDRAGSIRATEKNYSPASEAKASSESGERKPPIQEMLIKGLLSFGEETIFKLGFLNVLVGPNGSGKSNFIDCLRILQSAPFNVQEAFKDSGFEDWLYFKNERRSGSAVVQVIANAPEYPNRLYHQMKLGHPFDSRARIEEDLLSVDVHQQLANWFSGSSDDGAFASVSSVHEPKLTESMSSENSELPLRERWNLKAQRGTPILSGDEYDSFQSILSQIRDIGRYPEITRLARLYSSVRIYSEWIFGRHSNLRESTPTGRTDVILSESMDNLPLALNGLSNTAAHDKIRGYLKELKETYLDFSTRVSFGRVGLGLAEEPFKYNLLPASRLSDGTLRFLALAAILLQPNPPPLLCLEEPELGMHPDMIRLVANMIVEASARTQLIITTHSEHLLTDLQDDFDALFAFDAGLTGSYVRRYSQEDYMIWRQDHTLGELWTSGELGGNRW